MVANELRACPYCKGFNLGISTIAGKVFSVACADCGVTGPAKQTEDDASKAWNELSRDGCTRCVSRKFRQGIILYSGLLKYRLDKWEKEHPNDPLVDYLREKLLLK